MTAWHEDDELWAELLPMLTGEKALAAAPEDAKNAAALLQLDPVAHILDLGCGPGRHSIALARLGYRVTGIDRTSMYLAAARERAAAAQVEIELVQASMLAFLRPLAFDGAISILSSFGYFDDPEDDLRVLQNVCSSLKPGGRFVVDLVGKEIIGRIFVAKDWQEMAAGRFWLQDRDMAPGWEKMRMHWIFVGAGDRKEFSFEYRIYSGLELSSLLRRAGFRQVDLYGSLDGAPYDRNASRLVAVATK